MGYPKRLDIPRIYFVFNFRRKISTPNNLETFRFLPGVDACLHKSTTIIIRA